MKRTNFFKPLRKQHNKNHFRNAVEDEVINELESLGYSDEEIEALDNYIQEFIISYENNELGKLTPRHPYELIIIQHEEEEIEQWIIFNTNLRG